MPCTRRLLQSGSPPRRTASCLLTLLTYGVIHTFASLQGNPGSQLQPQQHAPGALLDIARVGGGASANNRRRKHHHVVGSGQGSHGGTTTGGENKKSDVADAVEVSGADSVRGAVHLDGVYLREWDVNDAPHFRRRSKRGSRSPPVHLFFTGNEWMLHLDVDENLDIRHCLAYSEVSDLDPLKTTRRWAVRVGQAWVRRPHMRLAETTPDAEAQGSAWRAKATHTPAAFDGYSDVAGQQPQPVTERGYSVSAVASQTLVSTSAQAAVDADATSDAALNRRLMPLYLVFVLDAIGLGVALPVLPFFVMGLKATALQLAIVVSSNYIAQTFGCVITGNMSDVVGRKPVVIGCLLGTVLSHIMVARSTTLAGVAWGRVVGGVTGGLTPIAQAAVADVVPLQSLPKYLGRIQACVGLGFVLGPMTMTILHRLFKVSTADTFFAAALFPLVGLVYAMFRMSETKVGETGVSQLWRRGRSSTSATAATAVAEQRVREGRERALASRRRRQRLRKQHGLGIEDDVVHGEVAAEMERGEEELQGEEEAIALGFERDGGAGGNGGPGTTEGTVRGEAAMTKDAALGRSSGEVIPRAVMLLVGNGFLLMYAFSIETIYAMFLKDNFGYGESVLSMVFALNGVAVGALQLLGMRHLVRLLGKHMMLIAGNVFLAAGMVGVALSRKPAIHFALFTVHIMGYSLADTALVALISRYASPATQGRSLGLNQAAQSMARVISPVVAGVLYEWSKRRNQLPLGALPYLVGSAFPLLGVAVPFWLYLRSVEAKKRMGIYTRGGTGTVQVGHENVEQTRMNFSHEKNL